MLRALLALIFAFSVAAPTASAQGAPLDQSTAWFYLAGSQSQGPYALAEMQDLTRQGVIRPTTQVFHPQNGWAFAKDTPELQSILSEAAPPLPPPPPPGAPPPRDAVDMQNELDQAAKDFLIGGWTTSSRQNMGGRVFAETLEFRFRADGAFDSVMSTSMPDVPEVPPSSSMLSGTWSVRALSAGRFVLTLDYQSGYPPDQYALESDGTDSMTTTDGKRRYMRLR